MRRTSINLNNGEKGRGEKGTGGGRNGKSHTLQCGSLGFFSVLVGKIQRSRLAPRIRDQGSTANR